MSQTNTTATKVGDQIRYRDNAGEVIFGTVTEVDSAIKHGEPGFVIENPSDYDGPLGYSQWGYDSQLIKINGQKVY